jgi:hypothetical protein
MVCTTRLTNVAVTPSTDDLKATLDPFGVVSSILLAANTKYQVVTTRAQNLAGNPLDQSKAQLIN